MKKSIIYISSLFLAAIVFSSCKKQLDVTPRQSIEVSSLFTSKDNINAAITGVYSRLKSNQRCPSIANSILLCLSISLSTGSAVVDACKATSAGDCVVAYVE